jgi:P27 family predicted phage terminase small subunit
MGRPAKPAEIRLLEGSRRHDGKQPPSVRAPGEPLPPAHLTAEQRAAWEALKLMCPVKLGLADSLILERGARAWVLAKRASETLEGAMLLRSGSGDVKKNPASAILRMANEELAKVGAELGLSPLARSRLVVEPPDDTDPLSQLMAMWAEKPRA